MSRRLRACAACLAVLAAYGADAASEAFADDPPFRRIPFADYPGQFYVTVPTRPGVTQGFLLIEPRDAVANVILFVGGAGDVGISAFGIARNFRGNFLMRTRDLFAGQALRVAVIDTPSDRPNLRHFRATPEHAQDIAAVIAYLRRDSSVPVWLVGTSRGTVSVANAAATLQGRAGPDGIVLSSSVLRRAGSDRDTVFSASLAAVTVPVQVVHHEQDRCVATPYGAIAALVKALGHARDVEVAAFTGGTPHPGANVCGGAHFHGYAGIEARVVAAIVSYIRSHLGAEAREGRRG